MLTSTIMGSGSHQQSRSVKLVLEAVAAWDRQDVDALLQCFDPQLEFFPTGEIPGFTEPIRGRDAYRTFFEQWIAAWQSFSLSATRVADLLDGRVLLETMQQGVGRAGIHAERRVFILAATSDEGIARFTAYASEQQALADAGLSRWPRHTRSLAKL